MDVIKCFAVYVTTSTAGASGVWVANFEDGNHAGQLAGSLVHHGLANSARIAHEEVGKQGGRDQQMADTFADALRWRQQQEGLHDSDT